MPLYSRHLEQRSPSLWLRSSARSASAPTPFRIHPPAWPLCRQFTLWAWERREDLHALDTRRFAVAYLDQTLTIGLTVEQPTPPRPPGLSRLRNTNPRCPHRSAAQRGAQRCKTAATPLTRSCSARASPASPLFKSISMPRARSARSIAICWSTCAARCRANLPLSITALASWCSFDDWLRGLPVDEAVPMMFRMEPDRRRAPPDLDDFRIREPLCQSSVGVSTTEPWPARPGRQADLCLSPTMAGAVDSPTEIERRLP